MKAKKVYEMIDPYKESDDAMALDISYYKLQVEKWAKKWIISDTEYIIDENGKLTIHGNFEPTSKDISYIPDNTTIYGWADLRETKIVNFPKKLTIDRGLAFTGTKITEIDKDLIVRGTVVFKNTLIKTWPIEVKLHENLVLSNCNLSSLPDNMTVPGTFDVQNNNLTELPENLTVGGSLYIRNNDIKTIPGSLKVGEVIYRCFLKLKMKMKAKKVNEMIDPYASEDAGMDLAITNADKIKKILIDNDMDPEFFDIGTGEYFLLLFKDSAPKFKFNFLDLEEIQEDILDPVILGLISLIRKNFASPQIIEYIKKHNIKEGVFNAVIKKSIYTLHWPFEKAAKQIKNSVYLYYKKANRSSEEVKEDNEYDTFVFIGYDDKKEVNMNGQKLFKRILGIEHLLKIDKFNKADLNGITMMKMRAKMQYPDDGGVYMIKFPAGYIEDEFNIPDHLKDLIDEHKTKI